MQTKRVIKTSTTLLGATYATLAIDKEPGFNFLHSVGMNIISGSIPGGNADTYMLLYTENGERIIEALHSEVLRADTSVPEPDRYFLVNRQILGKKLYLGKKQFDGNDDVAAADFTFQLILNFGTEPMKTKRKSQAVTVTIPIGTIQIDEPVRLSPGSGRLVGMRAYNISGAEDFDIGLSTQNGKEILNPVHQNSMISTTAVPIKDRMIPLDVDSATAQQLKLTFSETFGAASGGAQTYQFEFLFENE